MKSKKILICTLLLFGYGHTHTSSMVRGILSSGGIGIIGLNISVNSLGHAMAVWSNSGDNAIYASFFDGTSWSSGAIISDVDGGLSPWVSLNDNDKAVAIWQTSVTSGKVKTNTYVSSTWQPTNATVDGSAIFDNSSGGGYPLSRIRVGVDPAGNAVAVWVVVDNSTTPTNWYIKTANELGNNTTVASNWSSATILNTITSQQIFFDPNSQVFLIYNNTGTGNASAIVSWVQNGQRAYIARYPTNNISPTITSYSPSTYGTPSSNCIDVNLAGNVCTSTMFGTNNVRRGLLVTGQGFTECDNGTDSNIVYNVWVALSSTATKPILHQAASLHQLANIPFINPGWSIALQSMTTLNCSTLVEKTALRVDYTADNGRPRLNPMICSFNDNTAVLFWNSQGYGNRIGILEFDGQNWNTQGIQYIAANLPTASTPSLDAPFSASCSKNVSNNKHYTGLVWWDSSTGSVIGFISNGTQTPFAPSPATNITASTANCDNGSKGVTLNWQISTDTPSSIFSQTVLRNLGTGNTNYAAVSGPLANSVTSFVDNSINVNTTYNYFIRTLDSNGVFSDSNIIAIQCRANKPVSPVLSADGNTQNGAVVVNLTWSYPATILSSISGFQLYKTSPSGLQLIDSPNAQTFSYIDTDVSVNSTYEYYIYAVGTNGAQSDPSNLVVVGPLSLTPPEAPQNLRVVCNSTSSVTLFWDPAPSIATIDGAAQDVYKNGVIFASVSRTANSLSDTISPNTEYLYEVKSVIGKPEQYSNPASTTVFCTNNMPLPPSGVTATPVTGSTTATINLTWAASPTSGVTLYNIYRSGDSAGSAPGPIATVDITQNGPIYTDTEVTFDFSYTYGVSALLNGIESNIVPSAKATPRPNAPAQIANLSATCANSGSSIELTWSSPTADCTSQDIFRNGTYLATINNCSSATNVYTDSDGITLNTPYTYFIQAYNGSSSSTSIPITIECFASAPDAPIDISGSCILDPEDEMPALLIQWQVPSLTNIVSLGIYRNNDLIATTIPTATSFIDTSIAQGITYAYNISTVNNVSAETKSPTVRVDSCTIGNAPEIFSGTCGFNQFALEGEYFVTLNWKIPSTFSDNIASQTLSRDGIVIATLDANQRSYVDSNRPAGTTSTYTLEVKSKSGLTDVKGNTSVTC